MAKKVKGNTTAAVEFLRSWSEDQWLLCAITPEDRRITTANFDPRDKRSVEDARAWVEDRQGRENIYFTVNPVMNPRPVKAKKTDVRGMAWLHVDVDPAPPPKGADADAMRRHNAAERSRIQAELEAFDPPATVIIDSGGGFQGFWRLAEEQQTAGSEERAAELEAYNIQIAKQLGADNCHNLDRIMRLPGTVNVPDAKKRAKGREAAPTRVAFEDWRLEYLLTDFTRADAVQRPGDTGAAGSGEVQLSGNIARLRSVDDLGERVSTRTKMLIVQGDDPDDPTRYASRSEVLWAVMCQLVRDGVDDDTIASVILDPDFGVSAHVLDQPRSLQYAARQIKRAREEVIDPWLRKLNDQHCVIEDIGGKCRIISEVMDHAMGRTRLTVQSFEDFRNRYMHIPIQIAQAKNGNPVYAPLGKWWLENPNRNQRQGVVFHPGREVAGFYNLWRGFGCEALAGDCSLFLEHVRVNICAENKAHYEYLLNWMARTVQHPDSAGEVAAVLRGKMGVGKSFFARTFGSLFGRHYLAVSDPKHLVGSFNAHLRDCVVLFGDEAFYAGDKKHESILKTMVTEDKIMIEGKGLDAEAMPNYLHIILASNSDWVVPAGVDERRYFVLDVKDAQHQRHGYFRAIQDQMNTGGREALLHLLLTRDISTFEVRAFPRTTALQEQKLLSLSPEEQWWFEKLYDGVLVDGTWGPSVTKIAIKSDYRIFMEHQRQMRRVAPSALGKFLKKVCPGRWPDATQRMADVTRMDEHGVPHTVRQRVWFYDFPSLEDCRNHWDRHFGGPYDWPPEPEDAQEPDKDPF